jgi:cation transport regulator ChaB
MEQELVLLPAAFLTRAAWQQLSEPEQWEYLQLYATDELRADLSDYEQELYRPAFESYLHDYPAEYDERTQASRAGGTGGFSEAEVTEQPASAQEHVQESSSRSQLDQIRPELGIAPPPKPKKKR